MQQVNWNDIRIFLAVAESGKMGVAAQSLRLDPTTLGRRIRCLEKNLQLTLFERSRSGLSLTEAGEKLLGQAEAMADAARSIDEQIVSQSGLNGTLRISVSEGFGSQFLTHYVNDFIAVHPNIKLELVASSGFLSPSKREADIAVMLSRPKTGPVTSRKLADYDLRMFASHSYLANHGLPENVAELAARHTLISYVIDLIYAPELNYLDEIHPGLKGRVSSSSLIAQTNLVKEGVGIAVLPCFIGARNPDLVAVLPDITITRSFWLVAHQDTQNIKRIRVGKEWLINSVKLGHDRLKAS